MKLGVVFLGLFSLHTFAMQQSGSAKASSELIYAVLSHKDAPIHTSIEKYEGSRSDFNRNSIEVVFVTDLKELKRIEAERLSTDQLVSGIKELIRKGANPTIKDAHGYTAADYINTVLTIKDADRIRLLQALGNQNIQPRSVIDNLEEILSAFGPIMSLRLNSSIPQHVKNRLEFILFAAREDLRKDNAISILKIVLGYLSYTHMLLQNDLLFQRLPDATKRGINQQFEQIRRSVHDKIILLKEKDHAETKEVDGPAPQRQPKAEESTRSQIERSAEARQPRIEKEKYGELPRRLRAEAAEAKRLEAEQARAELIRQVRAKRKEIEQLRAEKERAELMRQVQEKREEVRRLKEAQEAAQKQAGQ